MDQFVSIREATKNLKTSNSTIRRALKRYKGPEYQKRINGKIYISPLFISAVIKGNRPEVLPISLKEVEEKPTIVGHQKSKGMKFLEKDLEDVIWDAIQSGRLNDLMDREFPTYNEGEFFRQYNFGQEWGVSDLIQLQIYPYRAGGNRVFNVNATVYELKKDKINYSALDQAVRYSRAIQQMIEMYKADGTYSIGDVNIKICLIGRTIDLSDSFAYLTDVIDGIDLYTYNFDAFDGITFKLESDYSPKSNRYPSDKMPSKEQLIDCMDFAFTEGIARRMYKRKEQERNIKQGLPF